MCKLLNKMLVAVIWIVLLPFGSSAAVISYSAQHLSGNHWAFDYVVSATVGPTIDEFTIYFDQSLFQNLAVAASPPDWDSLVVQPDHLLPSDGFFDSLALGPGLAPGSNLGGFRVTFDFLGAGAPLPQRFEIVDTANFAVLESGITTQAASVPEPKSLWLSLLALALIANQLGWRARRIKAVT